MCGSSKFSQGGGGEGLGSSYRPGVVQQIYHCKNQYFGKSRGVRTPCPPPPPPFPRIRPCARHLSLGKLFILILPVAVACPLRMQAVDHRIRHISITDMFSLRASCQQEDGHLQLVNSLRNSVTSLHLSCFQTQIAVT